MKETATEKQLPSILIIDDDGYFRETLTDALGLKSFKVVQHDLQRTSVQLVPGPGFDPGCEAAIVDGFRRRLGDAVQVEVQVVDSIAAEKSGKFRYIVSHVATAP